MKNVKLTWWRLRCGQSSLFTTWAWLSALYFQVSIFYVWLQSIGHAYEDIMSQNQQLLQQIIERDDHNTKVMIQMTDSCSYFFFMSLHLSVIVYDSYVILLLSSLRRCSIFHPTISLCQLFSSVLLWLVHSFCLCCIDTHPYGCSGVQFISYCLLKIVRETI